MPSRGPKSGQKCYVTPAFSRVANKGGQNRNWLPEPCLIGGPKVGGSAMSPLHPRGSPKKGNKIRIGWHSSAFSGAQTWAEVLRHPCILRGPQQRGKKSELATLAMPSQGPKSGQKCYGTPAFSGVPNRGEQNRNWLPQPSLLGGLKVGAAFWRCRAKSNKNKIGCLSHAFSGAQEWAEVLRHPCILGSPQKRGVKSELAATSMPSRGHKSWRCILGVPNKVQQK